MLRGPMKVLVTGARGLVGSRLAALLAARGHEVTAVGRAECDLADATAVRVLFERVRPDVVHHPASMTEVDRCEKEPERAWADNAAAAANVASASRASGAHLVHVSTDYVFDGDAGPYAEDAVPNPRGTYAQTKLAGELAVRALAGTDGWAIARTAVVYGWPPATHGNFGSWLVGQMSKGEKVRLFADQHVSPSLADNVAEMLAEIGERRLPGVWNVCGADVVDRVTFGHALCDVFGFDRGLVVPSSMKEVNLLSPRPARSGLVTKKTADALAAKPLGVRASLERFHAAWQRRST